MSDLKRRLETLADGFPEKGHLPGLEKRRLRRSARQRIFAAALALTISAVGAIGAFLVFEGSTSPAETPSGQSSLPRVLVIECDGQTATVLTPEVQVQADGVHLEARNTAGIDTHFSVSLAGGSDGSPSVAANSTEKSTDSRMRTGHGEVWCGPAGEDVNDGPPEATVEIKDPDGLYRSPWLECPPGEGGVSGIFDHFGMSPGEAGSPIEIVRRKYANVLRPSDVLDIAGYPEAERYTTTVRVVRDGHVLATFEYSPGAASTPERPTWAFDGYSACDGFNEELNSRSG